MRHLETPDRQRCAAAARPVPDGGGDQGKALDSRRHGDRRASGRPAGGLAALSDAAGEFTGALNLLVDITAARRRDEFLAHARRCRRLARTINDPETVAALQRMGEEYETTAAELAASA